MNYGDLRQMYIKDMFQAFKRKHYDIVKRLLDIAGLHSTDEYGNTSLMLSIMYNQNDIADLIISNADSILFVTNNKDEKNALMLAIDYENIEVIKNMLKRIKYNIYKEISEKLDKINTKLLNLSMEEMSFGTNSFDITNALSNMNVNSSTTNIIDNLKIEQKKLADDLNLLNKGIKWPFDYVYGMDLDGLIEYAEGKGLNDIAELFKQPPKEEIRENKMIIPLQKGVQKRRQFKPMISSNRDKEIEESLQKKSRKRREDIQEKLMSKRRREDDSDDDLGNQRKRRKLKKNKRKSKSKKRQVKKSKSRKRKSKTKSKRY